MTQRYAVVGLGSRSAMYTNALLTTYADRAELVGLCDTNRARMAYYNERFEKELGSAPIPTFAAEDFDRMLDEQRVDTVIVTSIDRTHHRYAIEAMERGCDVITEKPLTVDADKCRAILETKKRTGRRLTVTFNYRYAPRNSKLKELIQSGVIGEVKSVHFEWLLDTRHGADYFRRWHRDKRNSGGLMVHKASHHFDLANWWLGDRPDTVFGMGDLVFYGKENAEGRGEPPRYHRAHGSPAAKADPFALHLEGDDNLRGLYLDAEHEDGYFRDLNVFGDGISIEDDMAVLVRYAGGATLTYHLTAYSPWEGYRVMVNGTKGRLELDVEERSYISGDADDPNQPDPSYEPRHKASLLLREHWKRPEAVTVEEGGGGHGGGDRRLMEDLFGADPPPDPLGRAATHIDGAFAMLVGAAANRSFGTGSPVRINDLVPNLAKE